MARHTSGWNDTVRELFALRRNGYSGPFFVALSLFSMGAWLVVTGDTFGTSSAYDLMEEMALEVVWGAFMMAASVLMLSSSLRRRPREVSIGALGSAFVWFLMFSSFVVSSPLSMMVPLFLVMTVRSISISREFRTDYDAETGEHIAFRQRMEEIEGGDAERRWTFSDEEEDESADEAEADVNTEPEDEVEADTEVDAESKQE